MPAKEARLSIWPGNGGQVSTETEQSDLLHQAVMQEQVRLAYIQIKRIPLLHFLVDLGSSLIVVKSGVGAHVWGWLLVMTCLVTLRPRYIRWVMTRNTNRPGRVLNIMAASLALQGLWHSLIIVIAAMSTDASVHYTVSIIMLGVAAGAITPAAGYLPIFVGWAAIFGSVLGGSWLFKGTFEGQVFAALLFALMFLFATYVRDQGKTIRQLVTLADRLRRSRDRAEAEQRKAELARKEAQIANEARTRFFAAANHDLRQPLHALSLNVATVNVLAAQSPGSSLQQVSQVMQRSLGECRSLLDSLLDVSQLDAGAVQPSMGHVLLPEVLQSVVDANAHQAREKGLNLQLDAFTRETGASVLTDAFLLKRILNNLVGNAIKFTEHGQIRLSLSQSTHGWTVSVADTGRGIPADAFDKVFEEFYQLNNPERDRSRGLGLGLSIVRRLANLIGAQVNLASSSANGSRFDVVLPSQSIMDHEYSTASVGNALLPGGHEQSAIPLSKGYTILLVDDEQTVRDSLTTFFMTIGWQPHAVSDQASALEWARTHGRPDAAVIDFRLGAQGSGLDVRQALMTQLGPIPAVLVTGDTSPDRIAAAQQAGLPLMFKPVEGWDLALLLDQLIEQAVKEKHP